MKKLFRKVACCVAPEVQDVEPPRPPPKQHDVLLAPSLAPPSLPRDSSLSPAPVSEPPSTLPLPTSASFPPSGASQHNNHEAAASAAAAAGNGNVEEEPDQADVDIEEEEEADAVAPLRLRIGSRQILPGRLAATPSGRLVISAGNEPHEPSGTGMATEPGTESSSTGPGSAPQNESESNGAPRTALQEAEEAWDRTKEREASKGHREQVKRLKELQVRLHRILTGMGVELQLAPSPPFIGLLVAHVQGIRIFDSDLARGVDSVRAYLAEDKSIALPVVGRVEVPGPSPAVNLTIDPVPLVFVAIWSHVRFELGLKSKRSRLLGEAAVDVNDLTQGLNQVRMPVFMPSNNKPAAAASLPSAPAACPVPVEPVGYVDVEIDYRWLQGTFDDGKRTFSRRTRTSIKPRKTREGVLMIRDLFIANHRILSHDNIYPVRGEQAYVRAGEGEEEGGREPSMAPNELGFPGRVSGPAAEEGLVPPSRRTEPHRVTVESKEPTQAVPMPSESELGPPATSDENLGSGLPSPSLPRVPARLIEGAGPAGPAPPSVPATAGPAPSEGRSATASESALDDFERWLEDARRVRELSSDPNASPAAPAGPSRPRPSADRLLRELQELRRAALTGSEALVGFDARSPGSECAAKGRLFELAVEETLAVLPLPGEAQLGTAGGPPSGTDTTGASGAGPLDVAPALPPAGPVPVPPGLVEANHIRRAAASLLLGMNERVCVLERLVESMCSLVQDLHERIEELEGRGETEGPVPRGTSATLTSSVTVAVPAAHALHPPSDTVPSGPQGRQAAPAQGKSARSLPVLPLASSRKKPWLGLLKRSSWSVERSEGELINGDAGHGAVDEREGGGAEREGRRKGWAMKPILEGHFDYGLGRPAIRMSVLVMSIRAQDRSDIEMVRATKASAVLAVPSDRDVAPALEEAQPTHQRQDSGKGSGSGSVVPSGSGQLSTSEKSPSLGQSQSTREGLATAGEWYVWGLYRTNAGGDLKSVEVPERIRNRPGHYKVLSLLPTDNSFALGSLFMLRPGTRVVIVDVDGVLNTGDKNMVGGFALDLVSVRPLNLVENFDPALRPHAVTLCRLWAAKGYQCVYVSGRQGSWYNLSVQWFIRHGFPPGPVQLTRTRMPTLPFYVSVGNFKVNYIQSLRQMGFEIYGAYGNTITDVVAYEAAGIPKERTWIISGGGAESWFGRDSAGAKGTQKVLDWTHHVADVVLKAPDVPPEYAVPYVDLAWGEQPTYEGLEEIKESSSLREGGQGQGAGIERPQAHVAPIESRDETEWEDRLARVSAESASVSSSVTGRNSNPSA